MVRQWWKCHADDADEGAATAEFAVVLPCVAAVAILVLCLGRASVVSMNCRMRPRPVLGPSRLMTPAENRKQGLPLWLLPAIRRRYGSTVARIPSLLRCNAL